MMPSRAQADFYFEKLAEKLAVTALPTESGEERIAKADEFMLMQIDELGWVQFKHCDTRNYVMLHKDNFELYVPRTEEPFMRGTFDVFPPLSTRNPTFLKGVLGTIDIGF
jgi:hypothetical protein